MRIPGFSPARRGGGGGGESDDADDAGTDPTDPRDAPSARGNDTGGDAGSTVDVDAPNPTAPAPSPTRRGSTDVDVPDGASDGGGIGERVTSNLEQLGEIYTENVAEPVGDATAATNPAARLEQQTIGTDALAEVSEGVGEGVAQIGNVPGNAAAGIRAGQALAEASARSQDQVTIGGVPTGVSVPDREGQRENAQAAGSVAASAAASAAESPFETTGRVIGGALGGAAISRGVRGASRAADGDTPDAPDTPDGTVPSGRSNAGTDGVDSLLDDVDVDARRGTSGPSARSRLEGEVSRAVDDVTDRINDSPAGDFIADTRAQLQQQRPSGRDTGSAPDRTRPADAGGSFADVRQDSLTQTQDALRGQAERPDPGTFDGGPSPFRGGGGGDTIDPDGGVSLERGGGVVDELEAGAGATTSGPGVGTGAGLGVLAAVNDPTSVSDTDERRGSRFDPTQTLGAGAGPSSFGAAAVRDELGAGRLGGGTLPDDATDTRSETAAETDTFAPTGTEPGTDTPTDTDTATDDLLATTTITGTRTDTSTAPTDATLSGARTVGDPVTSTDGVARLGGGGSGGGGRTLRPRPEEEPDQDDDAAALLGFATDSREFGSGIASASDFLGGDGARGPFSL